MRATLILWVPLIAAAYALGCRNVPDPYGSFSVCEDPGYPPGMPAIRVDPIFPWEADAAGVDEGYVDVSYSVGPDGRTRSLRIVRSEPEGVFDRAALDAVSRWVFCPPEGGLSEHSESMQTRISFERAR
jgi:TonB family protein